ncbi:hypothetical protein B0H19DRAFT_991716 [Mycena capillaripes]|nr:hypothetical protein B0H19DRAFT_991716 [Mycena capillaripes]
MYDTTTTVPTDACFAVKCDKCSKTTWKGCGQHVDSVSTIPSFLPSHSSIPGHPSHLTIQVMKDIKDEDKCVCPRE